MNLNDNLPFCDGRLARQLLIESERSFYSESSHEKAQTSTNQAG
jgi:hypothetical protein